MLSELTLYSCERSYRIFCLQSTILVSLFASCKFIVFYFILFEEKNIHFLFLSVLLHHLASEDGDDKSIEGAAAGGDYEDQAGSDHHQHDAHHAHHAHHLEQVNRTAHRQEILYNKQ